MHDSARSLSLLPLSSIVSCCMLITICSGCGGSESEPTAADTTANNAATADSAAADAPATESEEVIVERGSAVDDPDRVLRHAVFFSFKESSSAEDVQSVVDAFRALPSKIPEIIDFQWGVNNSPEGLNDGFTHCFLLTFQDEAGRETYLPHPEHKAFGDVLRPHMDKVFVIDYWGKPAAEPLDTPLQHAVFFKFKEDAADEDVVKVEEGFAALPSKIDFIRAFEWGVNNSPERHDAGFTHCFMVTFASPEDRDAYIPHPDHKAFVEVLMPVLDKVRVLDFTAAQ
jgi:hypothetical protein